MKKRRIANPTGEKRHLHRAFNCSRSSFTSPVMVFGGLRQSVRGDAVVAGLVPDRRYLDERVVALFLEFRQFPETNLPPSAPYRRTDFFASPVGFPPRAA